MQRTEIKLKDGRTMPHEITLGAMLRFKRETGKEISEADLNNIEELASFIHCGVLAAGSLDGREPDIDKLGLMDRIEPEELERWSLQVLEAQADSKKKKKAR